MVLRVKQDEIIVGPNAWLLGRATTLRHLNHEHHLFALRINDVLRIRARRTPAMRFGLLAHLIVSGVARSWRTSQDKAWLSNSNPCFSTTELGEKTVCLIAHSKPQALTRHFHSSHFVRELHFPHSRHTMPFQHATDVPPSGLFNLQTLKRQRRRDGE